MPTPASNAPFEQRGRARMHFSTIAIEKVPPSIAAAQPDRPVVLVVENDPLIAERLVDILRGSGYAAIAAYDGEDALDTALLVPPHVVITESTLPDMSGIEVAAALKGKLPAVKVVLLDGNKTASGEVFAVVEKPIHPAVLLETVSASLKSGAKDPAALIP